MGKIMLFQVSLPQNKLSFFKKNAHLGKRA